MDVFTLDKTSVASVSDGKLIFELPANRINIMIPLTAANENKISAYTNYLCVHNTCDT